MVGVGAYCWQLPRFEGNAIPAPPLVLTHFLPSPMQIHATLGMANCRQWHKRWHAWYWVSGSNPARPCIEDDDCGKPTSCYTCYTHVSMVQNYLNTPRKQNTVKVAKIMILLMNVITFKTCHTLYSEIKSKILGEVTILDKLVNVWYSSGGPSNVHRLLFGLQ